MSKEVKPCCWRSSGDRHGKLKTSLRVDRQRERERSRRDRGQNTLGRHRESERDWWSAGRNTDRQTDSDRGPRATEDAQPGPTAESPSVLGAALRGFLRGRGKVVGERAARPAMWTVISRIRAGAARARRPGPGNKRPLFARANGGS
jgi:hypothetical protein